MPIGRQAIERMQAHNFQGEIVVQQIVEEDMVEVEKLLEDAKTVASVPEEMEVPAPVEEPPAPVPVEEPEVVRGKKAGLHRKAWARPTARNCKQSASRT